jgi:hypothetical protein
MLFEEYEICNEETISKLWNLINNSTPQDWWRESDLVEWRISIPPDTFDKDIKTTALINKFVAPNRMFIQRLEPRTSYNWHMDYERNSSLTMCLNQFDSSLTLFSENRENQHFCELKPLYYKPSTMYLFNGSEWHCGINYSNEIRYLVSISMTRPTTIVDAQNFLKNTFS